MFDAVQKWHTAMGAYGIDVGEIDFAEPNVWPGYLMGVSGIEVGELDFAEPRICYSS